MLFGRNAFSALVVSMLALPVGSFAQEGAAEPAPPPPDEVFLTNGDRITGKIVALADGKLEIETSAAGTLQIDWAMVESLHSNSDLNLVLAGGEELRGRADRLDGQRMTLNAQQVEERELALASIEAINPTPPGTLIWTGNISGGFIWDRGNTDQDNSSADGFLQVHDEDDRFTARGKYYATRVRNLSTGSWNTTDRYAMGQLQYDRFLSEKLFVYIQGIAEADRIKQVRLRLSGGVGAGYQFLDEENFKGSAELGLNWIDEDFNGTAFDDEYLAARLAVNLDWSILDDLRYLQNTQYFPSLETGEKYLIRSDHRLRYAFSSSFFVQGGVYFDYDNNPAPGVKNLDTRYTVQVGWNF